MAKKTEDEKIKDAKPKAPKEKAEKVNVEAPQAGKEEKAGKPGKAKKGEKAGKEEKTEKAGKPGKKKKARKRIVPEGHAYIQASYNNTIVSLTEKNGNVIAWASAGSSGFKGARKATPYASQVAAEKAVEKAKVFGMERAHVFVNGVGAGREQAIRGLASSGIDLLSITDVTSFPHNGCRKKKQRRV